MTATIDHLFGRYDRGMLTRRQLVQALFALAVPSTVAAQGASSVLTGRSVNHVQINTSDVAKSREFYEKVFGMTATGPTMNGQGRHVSFPGAGYISLQIGAKPIGGIGHFAVGIDDFDQDRVVATLKRAMPEAKVTASTDGSVYIADPDGVGVQIVSKDDRGLTATAYKP